LSNQADIRDIQALGDLKAAFGRFGEELQQILPSLQKQLEEIQERLDDRQQYWRRRSEEAQEALYAARRSLNECECQGEDDDGNSPDCSFEQDQVADAERALAENEDNLETVKQWRHRIESQIADFQNDIYRLSNLASSRTGSAQAFLANKIETLNNYIGGSSAVVGTSGLQSQGGNDKMRSREAPLAFYKIDDALLWANRNMHPDHLKFLEPERQALKDYQLGSRELNEALWEGLPLSPETKSQADYLDAAFACSATPVALKVWHGSEGAYWEEAKVGQVVRIKGFLSTTLAEQLHDFAKGAWLEITVPKGTPSIFMDNLAGSPLYETEVEILLARGTQLKILSKNMVDDELHIKAEISL